MSDIAVPDFSERLRRFNETTGVYGYLSKSGPLGGNHHPDRCVCQGNPNRGAGDRTQEGLRRGACGPRGDTTPHKHYREPPYACARCTKCKAYVPHDEAAKLALREGARAIVASAQAGLR